MGIGDVISTGIESVGESIAENPLASIAIAGGTGLVVGAGSTAIIAGKAAKRKKKKKKTKKKYSKSKKKRRKSKKKRRKSKKKNGRKRTRKTKRRGRRTPRTAGKGRDRSTRRIRYTAKGQPYVILRNGRARFIKKSSARRSHKLKGGRY